MKLYVLETGEYEDREERGVFSSPEKAKAAWQPPRRASTDDWPMEQFTYTWSEAEYGWEFDAPFDDMGRITEWELDDAEESERRYQKYVQELEAEGESSDK